MGSKKKKAREKGKLNRSGVVSIGGTEYNVHPTVQKCMEQMYREGHQAIERLKVTVELGEQQVKLLDKAVTILEPMDLAPEVVKWIQDVKDLMKDMSINLSDEAPVAAGPELPPVQQENENARHNNVPGGEEASEPQQSVAVPTEEPVPQGNSPSQPV